MGRCARASLRRARPAGDDVGVSGAAGKRRGRRAGGQDTREALLAAAREVFAEQGYNRATVRGIAGRAEVDPAMVNHWFGGKDALFTAAVSLPVNPATFVPQVLAGDREHLGERLVRAFLGAWDSAGGGGFAAVVRSLAAHDSAMTILREFVTTAVFGRVVRSLGTDRPQLRAALCGSQIVGLGVVRYVVRLEPLASADHDAVAAAVGPTIQHYVSGEIRGEFPAPESAAPQ